MKLLLVFVGALCLVHGMDLEELMDTVNNAVGISRLKLATAIQQLNSTIETADQTYQTAWSQYYQSIVDLYTSYYNRFQNHSSIDLSPLNGTIDYLNRYAYPPSNISSHFVSDIVADLEKSATNIGGYLSLAVSIMTHDLFPCASPTVVHCIKKFGPKLITAPITIDRLAECVTTELPRLSTLSVRRASQYDIVLDSVKKHLKVVDVCDKPAAGVLTPSTECLSHYIKTISNNPRNDNPLDSTHIADPMRIAQYRIQRCAKLVQLDVKDRIEKMLEDFQGCMA